MPNKSDTKNRIMDATWKLFLEMSPKAPTLKDVAKTAGVSRQAVYLHFDNRTRLLIETIKRMQQEQRAAERLSKTREADPERVITLWLGTMFDLYEMILPVARTFIATALVDKDGASAWDELLASVRRSVRNVVEHFHALGMLKPSWSVETAIDWIYANTSFTTWHLLVHELGWSNRDVLVRTVESLETSLLDFTMTGRSDPARALSAGGA